MKRVLLCVGVLSLWGMGAIAENGPLEPHVTSSEHPSGLASLGLEVASYAPGCDPIRFRTPSHLAFGPGSQEIVSDLKNNRFVFRDSPEDPFQVSPITLNGQHSLVYNPVDKLYYANDTDNHRIISFADLSRETITAQTKSIAGVTLKRPHDIVLDPATGWIYTINPQSGHVFRFTAIGENESAIAVPLQGYARALTFTNGKLYAIGSAKGRIVEIVDWETPTFKIYDSFDPTKKNGPAGSWTQTGLVLNDAEFFDGFWYATSFFTKSFAGGSDFDENKFIRFKTLDDLVTGNWTDLSSLVPSGMVPYYLTVNGGNLYLAIFNQGARGSGDSILQLSPGKPSFPPAKNNPPALLPHLLMANDQEASVRPNIVLIMADDLGYECIGANGGTSYKTPVLDNLAATGVRFEHCYAQPLCTPSRVQLMTGMYNVRNYVAFGVLDREQTTFAHLLKKSGYTTCIAGKWQLGRQADAPQHFGFDQACLWQHTIPGAKGPHGTDNRYVNPQLDINGKTATLPEGSFAPDVCADFICDFMEKNQDKPFLVYYPMILTHCPFAPVPDSADWDPKSKGSKTYKGDAKYFGDNVTYMDKMVGRITAKLDALGVRDNTLILFVGDNGTDKPVVSVMDGRKVAGGKRLMTDAGTRVPLIASWSGTISKGLVTSDLVDFSDFLPTLCETADVTVPPTLKIDGRSFLPQLLGKEGNPREWIYSWYNTGGGPKGREWVRNQRYKLYRTGKFYDISNDVLEKQPLKELSPEAQEARALFEGVLDTYKNARPAAVAAKGKQKTQKPRKKRN